MVNKADADKARPNCHRHVRGKATGTAEHPRPNILHPVKNIYAQIIDDVTGVTLAAASMLGKEFTGNDGNREAAKQAGELIAKRAAKKGITEAMFDCGGYVSHGRVKELVEGVREDDLKF